MPLKVKYAEKDIVFSLSKNRNSSKDFSLLSVPEDVEIFVPFTLSKEVDGNPEDFEMYILYSYDPPENAIFQVYEREPEKRIGWIFPLQSIVSKEHDYAEDQYYLEYANIALKKLLADKDDYTGKNIPEYDTMKSSYSIVDFYPHNAIILVLEKKLVSSLDDLWLNNNLPALFKNGYSNNRDVKKIKTSEEIEGNSTQKRKKIYLTPVCRQLRNNKFIELLINEISKKDVLTPPLLKFHLLYQVIEILLNGIFSTEMEKIIIQYNNEKTDSHDLRDQLLEINKDKVRLEKLFIGFQGHLKFKNLYRNFSNKEEEISFHNALYEIRNQLVHRYHELASHQKELLKEINSEFEAIILDLLMRS